MFKQVSVGAGVVGLYNNRTKVQLWI